MKKYADIKDTGSSSTSDASIIPSSLTHDVIGKKLTQFYRAQLNDYETHNVPYVFIQIYDYFDSNPELISCPYLFKK